jgi:hypothetical protein
LFASTVSWWTGRLADAGLVAQTVARVVSVPLSPEADAVSTLVNYFYPARHC